MILADVYANVITLQELIVKTIFSDELLKKEVTMRRISKTEYVALRKKGQSYMKLPVHDENLQSEYDSTWEDLSVFLHQSPEDIRDWQLNRLSYLVDYAFDNIPLYHKKYSEVGYKKGSIKTWADFYRLPYLRKEELIEGFPGEIVKDIDDFMLSTRSSGSSGKFVTIAVSQEAIYKDTLQTIRQFYMQSGGKYCADDTILFIYTCPWWVSQIKGKFVQDFLPTTTKVEDAIERIKTTRPRYISTYPTYLEKIASTGVKLSDYGVELVIVHSEQSDKKQRKMLAKALNVEVLDEYSSEELTRIALECPNHHYHLEEDACFIEIIDKDGNKLPDGQLGIVVGTNLLNTATPIIRYIQGDLAKITTEENCECGNNGRIIEGVKGRNMDCVITDTGERIPASCFMDIAYNWFLVYDIPVHGLKYQFVQPEVGKLDLYIIEGEYSLQLDAIKETIYTLIPRTTQLNVYKVDKLPYDQGTKYRPVISLVGR